MTCGSFAFAVRCRTLPSSRWPMAYKHTGWGGETCEDLRAIWSSFEQFQSWGCPGCPIIFGIHCGIFCPNLHKKVLDLRATLWPEVAVVDGYWWYPMMGHGLNFAAEITDNLAGFGHTIVDLNHDCKPSIFRRKSHDPYPGRINSAPILNGYYRYHIQWIPMISDGSIIGIHDIIGCMVSYHPMISYIYITITYGCNVAWLPSLI